MSDETKTKTDEKPVKAVAFESDGYKFTEEEIRKHLALENCSREFLAQIGKGKLQVVGKAIDNTVSVIPRGAGAVAKKVFKGVGAVTSRIKQGFDNESALPQKK